MAWSSETLRGTVNGTSIVLEHKLEIPDGSQIEVVVRRLAVTPEMRRQRLEALFGTCAIDADDLDDFIRWNRQQRVSSRPEIVE
ncbi:MAG: hypothetical protein JNM43_26710 [Planctomycetaceae bacterium]|nr:hypothetical protein [Planctomycetaceae bacterium]